MTVMLEPTRVRSHDAGSHCGDAQSLRTQDVIAAATDAFAESVSRFSFERRKDASTVRVKRADSPGMR